MAKKIIDTNSLSHFLAKLKLWLPTVYAKAEDIPTKTSELTNDSTYQTSAQVQASIADALSGITGIEFEVVASLPVTGKTGVIYLVANGGSNPNVYDEYIWIASSSKFEKIGTTDVDLAEYVTYNSTQDTFNKGGTVIAQYATNAEIDALFS